ncbi:unnamed protein product, partial [Rotaria socialis]
MAKTNLKTATAKQRILWKVINLLNQIFLTWSNGNEEQLGSFLQTIRDKSPNVQFQKLIASSVPFLNAFVQNQNGDLFSRIHRHPLIQGYSLPYE